MIKQLILFLKKIFEGPISIVFFRFIGYSKPYRVALIRMLPIIFKRFRPHYHSVIYESTQTALKLNLKKISIIEFGVAGGHGLLAIEKYCDKLSKKYNLEFEIYGFDLGDSVGLSHSNNPKDLPYFWDEGEFKMNLNKLKNKLNKAKLIIGDVAESVKKFNRNSNAAPIGAIFFDLDYYSSTVNAFEIFNNEDKNLLPRIICYFDDLQPHVNNFNGEIAAINEFNARNDNMKITKDYGTTLNYYYGPGEEEVYIFHNNKIYLLERFTSNSNKKQEYSSKLACNNIQSGYILSVVGCKRCKN